MYAGLIFAQKAIANLDNERHRGGHPFKRAGGFWPPNNKRKGFQMMVALKNTCLVLCQALNPGGKS
jgi:hypothetical protein